MIRLESYLSTLNIIHISYTMYSMHSKKLVVCTALLIAF